MDLLDLIQQAQGGNAVQNLGQQFGLNQSQTQDALSALLPTLAGAVHQNASSPDGLSSLLGALAGGDHGRHLDEGASLTDAAADGNGILGHLFGDKQVSREVASRAAAQTGIGSDVLKQMLPVVAAMLMGGLAKKASGAGLGSVAGMSSSGGGLGDVIGGLAGSLLGGGALGGGSLGGGSLGGGPSTGATPQPQAAGGGLLDMLTPLIDRNHDGSAMDDILGMAAGFLKR